MNPYVQKDVNRAGSIPAKFDTTRDRQNYVQYNFAALIHGGPHTFIHS
jgi:hypothetical protein